MIKHFLSQVWQVANKEKKMESTESIKYIFIFLPSSYKTPKKSFITLFYPKENFIISHINIP